MADLSNVNVVIGEAKSTVEGLDGEEGDMQSSLALENEKTMIAKMVSPGKK